jgi:chorismate--pyruvate lyase
MVWRSGLSRARLRLQKATPLAAWLLDSGSLTQHLRDRVGPVSVRRLHQGTGTARADEAQALGLPGGRARRVHVREVVLSCEGQPLVMARSVCEIRHLRGAWRALKGLGSRPLAALLFKDRAVWRLPLTTACLAAHQRMGQVQAGQWQHATGQVWPAGVLWQRRSVFLRHGAPLLVAELFAPTMQAQAGPEASIHRLASSYPRPLRATRRQVTR